MRGTIVLNTNKIEMKKHLKLTLLSLLVSCTTGPVPIKYGKDNCELCKMTIMDNKFGSEIITDKGKVMKFDSDECMRDYYNKEKPKLGSVLVTDFNKPGTLIDGKTAYYIHSDKMKSPMGGNLGAFASKKDADEASKRFPGDIWTWEKLISQ